VAPIKNDDTHSAGYQIVEAANCSARIGERKLGSLLADRRDVSFFHATRIAALAT
jgi:hypothetical protein